MSGESLGIKAGRAAIWQIVGGGWQTLVRLGASIYLARALKPSDFGLFGMALLYQELMITALSLGFGSGLIVKKDLSQEDLSTAFWLSCSVRIVIFLVVFFTAPIAANFWKEPRVEPVIRLISFTLLIQIIGMIPGTLATKNLEFKKINIIQAIAILLESLTAIILVAFAHLTYWALVIGMMISAVFYNLSLWVSARCWLPRFVFHKEVFRYLFRFGVYAWLFSITNYLKQNIDYFLVGRILGANKLGLYEFAYRLPHLVLERISRPVGNVLFPSFAKMQDNNVRLYEGYIKSVKYVCFVCYPVLFILAGVSELLVPLLWGSQWLPVIRPLQILCLCAALRCIFQPMGGVFYSKNRPDIPFKISFVVLIFTTIVVGVLGHFYGLNGVAIGMLFSVFPSFLVLWFAFRVLLNVNPIRLFCSLLPIVVSSFLSAVVTFSVARFSLSSGLEPVLGLCISLLFGFSVYILSFLVFFRSFFEEVFETFGLIFGRFKFSWKNL